MIDIYIGLGLVFTISIILFKAGKKIAKNVNPIQYYFILFFSVISIYVFSNILHENVFLSRIFPFSNLIIIGNFIPEICAFIIGMSINKMSGKILYKCLYIIPFLIFSLYYSYNFLFLNTPQSINKWKNNICIQTSKSTCSAASIATLLRYYNIAATENELIDLCFTTIKGTSWFGIYRGLYKKTHKNKYKVIIEQTNSKKVNRKTMLPAIIQVGLKNEENIDPRYEKNWGWIPETFHTIVLFDIINNKVEIGDTSIGREFWDLKALDDLWTGKIMYLKKL